MTFRIHHGSGKKFFHDAYQKFIHSRKSEEILARAKSYLATKEFVRPFLDRNRLDSIFREAPVAICTMEGPHHIFTAVNDFYFEILGEHREIIGRPAREVFPRLVGQGIFDLLDRVYRGGHVLRASEIRMPIVGKDGSISEHIFEFVCKPTHRADGKVTGVVLIASDISDQVHARETAEQEIKDLREEVQSRDRFLSIASHELKSPITCIKLNLQLARRRLPAAKAGQAPDLDTDKLLRSIDTSTIQADRLRALVDDLMDSTRIRSGKMSYHFERGDLSHLIRQVVETFEPEAARAGVTIHADVPANLMVNYDCMRMEQVLVNLISNALKYAPSSPIQVSAVTEGDDVIFSVVDRGPGIDPRLHEKIFERFQRGESATSASGLGLGLFIVREIVRGHGGEVVVDSKPGKGACFCVRLPINGPSEGKRTTRSG